MLKKLSTTAIPGLFVLLMQPLQALAQQAPTPNPPIPQQYYWPGPRHMWGAWSFGPIMMIFFAVFCMAMMYFMMGGMHRGSRHEGRSRPLAPRAPRQGRGSGRTDGDPHVQGAQPAPPRLAVA